MAIAIIAYGSLISEPGEEIAANTVERRLLPATPFSVEFARSSMRRSGAPTLVPVLDGGAPLPAQLLVLRESVTLEEASDILYRREAAHPRKTYAASGANWIADAGPEGGLTHRLYVALQSNIAPTPGLLADLAIGSAIERDDGRDGISYLIDIRQQGIETPLTDAYEKAVLERTARSTLEAALAFARSLASARPSSEDSFAELAASMGVEPLDEDHRRCLRAHVEELCKQYGLEWRETLAVTDLLGASACLNEGWIETPPLESELAYWHALHEIGHIATELPTHDANGAVVLRNELDVWEWAIDNALVLPSGRAGAGITGAFLSHAADAPGETPLGLIESFHAVVGTDGSEPMRCK
jgi:hypothetical protein